MFVRGVLVGCSLFFAGGVLSLSASIVIPDEAQALPPTPLPFVVPASAGLDPFSNMLEWDSGTAVPVSLLEVADGEVWDSLEFWLLSHFGFSVLIGF